MAKYIAYVSVRASEVLSVEDLAVDNPEMHAGGLVVVGQEKPLKITIGSLIQLKGASRAVACSKMREEVLDEVTRVTRRWFWQFWRTGFLTFEWVDPDMRTSA